MKKNLFIICFLLVSITVFSQNVIERPAFSSTTHSNVTVEKIELDAFATVLHMKIHTNPNLWWRISSETYILADNNPERLYVTLAEGVGLDTEVYSPDGVGRFTLYFPPIDPAVKQISFIESDCPDCFKIYGISLDKSRAREVYDENTNSSVHFNGSSYNVMFSWHKKKKFDPHWTGVSFSFLRFSDMDDVHLKGSKSYSIALNPVEYYVPVYRNLILVSGLGIDWSRYHFKGDYELTERDGITGLYPAEPLYHYPEESPAHYKSSKLLAYYITVPLLLEFQTRINKSKNFYISGGIIGYFKCYSKSQVQVSGNNHKMDKGRDLNLLPVNGRLMCQIGLNNIGLTGQYSPISLFEKDKGPDWNPVSFGVRLDF